jgi:hypothetical protein
MILTGYTSSYAGRQQFKFQLCDDVLPPLLDTLSSEAPQHNP